MRREHLIPLDKSKRVIYLEPRGKRDRGVFCWQLLLNILGILSWLYCACIPLFMGYGSNFFLIWAALGAGLLGFSWLLSHKEWLVRLPRWLKWSLVVGVAIVCLIFIIIEGMVLSQFGAEVEGEADYVIVLGAQWKENGPSYVLQKRLDKAVEYLSANPDTKVIVSGGQGSNEPISEAQGMKEYLVATGILEERIQMEDKSTSTYENLILSSELLNTTDDRVVLITNNFHVFRATSIARRQGYLKVEGLAADSHPGMLPNNLFREFFCVVKDFLVGNM